MSLNCATVAKCVHNQVKIGSPRNADDRRALHSNYSRKDFGCTAESSEGFTMSRLISRVSIRLTAARYLPVAIASMMHGSQVPGG